MSKKTPIKIIKREERNRLEKEVAAEKEPRQSTQEAAREIVNNVTHWVQEFQQKRRAETAQAIKTLLSDRPAQPSEA